MGLLIVGGIVTFVSIGTTATYNGASLFLATKSEFEVVTAKSVLVLDSDSNAVIYERNADEQRPIASITKLFTAYTALRSKDIDTPVLIEWQDYSTEGSAGSLKLGETYTLRDLLFPLLLSSSNDAGTAIERKLGYSTFQSSLKETYADAGLSYTALHDGTGLSSNDVSTARDLATFLTYLRTKEPHILDITTLRSYGGNYRGWINNDPGRSFESFRGGKHGYTTEAGRTFAGFFTTEHGEYTVVLLGSTDLLGDLDTILNLL